MITRRDFIKTMSLLSGAVLTPVRWLGKWAGVQAQTEEPPVEGELYAGFVLLPEGTPIPPFVQCAPAPILCQADDQRDPKVKAYRGETLWFNSMEGLAGNLSFPVSTPAALPGQVVLMHRYIVRFAQSRQVFTACFDFGFPNNPQPLISFSARPVFPQPYPVWPVPSMVYDAEGEPVSYIPPEKVDFTPASGLMLPTEQGHVFYWIKRKILYTLLVEHDPDRAAAIEMVKSLIET